MIIKRQVLNILTSLRHFVIIILYNLCIETGLYYGINRNNRNCIMCDLNVVEDEFHFILQCSKYVQLRRKYIKKYYWSRPSTFTFCGKHKRVL